MGVVLRALVAAGVATLLIASAALASSTGSFEQLQSAYDGIVGDPTSRWSDLLRDRVVGSDFDLATSAAYKQALRKRGNLSASDEAAGLGFFARVGDLESVEATAKLLALPLPSFDDSVVKNSVSAIKALRAHDSALADKYADAAVSELAGANAIQANWVTAVINMALAYERSGNFQRAYLILNRAMLALPGEDWYRIHVLAELSCAAAKSGHPVEAQTAMKVLRSWGGNDFAKSFTQLAAVFRMNREPAVASELLNQVLRGGASVKEAWLERARLEQAAVLVDGGDYSGAMKLLDALVKNEDTQLISELSERAADIAVTLASRGDIDSAIKVLVRMIEARSEISGENGSYALPQSLGELLETKLKVPVRRFGVYSKPEQLRWTDDISAYLIGLLEKNGMPEHGFAFDLMSAGPIGSLRVTWRFVDHAMSMMEKYPQLRGGKEWDAVAKVVLGHSFARDDEKRLQKLLSIDVNAKPTSLNGVRLRLSGHLTDRKHAVEVLKQVVADGTSASRGDMNAAWWGIARDEMTLDDAESALAALLKALDFADAYKLMLVHRNLVTLQSELMIKQFVSKGRYEDAEQLLAQDLRICGPQYRHTVLAAMARSGSGKVFGTCSSGDNAAHLGVLQIFFGSVE